MKRLLFSFGTALFFIVCICRPSVAITGASAGLSLWYSRVLPALLPCMILSGYLTASGLFRRLPPSALALTMGWFCGYPMGAKTVAALWNEKRLSESLGRRLLALVGEPSPMFLTGFLCAGMLRIPPEKVLFYVLSVYLPAVIFFGIQTAAEAYQTRRTVLIDAGIFSKNAFHPVKPDSQNQTKADRSSVLRKHPVSKTESAPSASEPLCSPLDLFEESLMDSMILMTKIGMYLMLFTMLSYFLTSRFAHPVFQSLLPGILEMTSGTAFTIRAGLSGRLTAALCFSYAAFGGCSILAQTKSALRGTPFSIREIAGAKLLQAAGTFLMIYGFYPML